MTEAALGHEKARGASAGPTPLPAGLRQAPTPAQHAWISRRRAIYSVIGGLALWEFTGQFLVTNPILFSPLSKVLAVGWKLLLNGELMRSYGGKWVTA